MHKIKLGSLNELKDLVGKQLPPSDWQVITQERINLFAQAGGDEQWIHVDPARAAKESPFGVTVAHGFLTLSLLSRFFIDTVLIEGVTLSINYGVNKVRFTDPVLVNARVRAHFTLMSLEPFKGGVQITWNISMEQEGKERPCLIAEWVSRRYGEFNNETA
ncbi:MaoC family dehydratase [Polynucleobacter sp. JS-Fieb-80-E5]|jgi:acyl dehydratase|uniref:MaoC family dehydratase n=1 Tax=Polynucleobacter sp. JS-Fieb-80-E5 TaxID=2081050 RepID=UPI001C0B3FA2|nr:MaoC family dehydratase [Polynucleobacter sp. JS-Fieb-80-E5]MBU3619389.1 MaoC family dehydratase [Polynucleobacter sp. JS-Fieb-80-E5]